MVGEIESEQAGGLADVVTLHQQNFRLPIKAVPISTVP